jgi:ribonuclease VapC
MTRPLMVETSALAAIILEEDGWRPLAEQIAEAKAVTTCVNIFETALALSQERGFSPTAANEIVEAAAESLGVEIHAVSPPMHRLAAEARERFGAGRYGLNMGDCLSYAAARHFRARLVYKGNDFARTDVND